MAEETVIIRFQGDASSVETAANQASNAVDGVGKSAKQSGGGFSALQSIATGAFQAIGSAATNLAGAALSKIGDFISGSIQEAADWNKVIAQTEAVVASTGKAAGFSAQEIAQLASNMSAASGMSIFSDDAILGAENVLATFTQVKGDEFVGATQAILDISQALGTDLQSSAIQVGKALNDPIKGIAALSRVGVSFTADQEAMIKAMVEAGDVAGAQNVILNELATEFGGSASAAVDTFAGQQVVLAEQFKNVQQSLGESLMPVLMRFGSFAQEVIVPAVQDLVNVFIKLVDGVNWDDVMRKLGGVSDALYDVTYGADWQSGVNQIGTAFAGFVRFIDPIIVAVQNLGLVVVPIFSSMYNSIMKTLGNPAIQASLSQTIDIFTLLGQILVQLVGIAIDNMRKSLENLFTTFTILWPYVSMVMIKWTSMMQPLGDLVIGVLTAISQALRGDFAGAWDTVKNAVTNFVTIVNNAINGLLLSINTALRTMIQSIISAAISIGTSIANGIAQGISAGATAIVNAAKSAASSALDAAKKLLGIASPSKVFAEQVGYQMSAGMAAGIVKGIPDVTGAISAATGASSGAATQTIQNYYLSASYQTAQSESSISQDLRAMQLLAGGMA